MTTDQNPKTSSFFAVLATIGRGLVVPFTQNAAKPKPVQAPFSGANKISFKHEPLSGYFDSPDPRHQARHMVLVAFERSATNFNICVFRNAGNYTAVSRQAELIASEVWIKQDDFLRRPRQVFIFTPGGARPITGEDKYEVLIPGKWVGPATDSQPVLQDAGVMPEALSKTLRDIDRHYPPTAENAVRVMTYDTLDFDV